MKIAVLTSSRADYGIYRPLLKRLQEEPNYELKMIVFGTHLSPFHGYTVEAIEKDNFNIDHKIETLILGDSQTAIANAMGTTTSSFAMLWEQLRDEIDLVFALGDRYEMHAAVSASVPFNIPIAHLHGGETTLGAIDNVFRHSISIMSTLHFATTDMHCKKIAELTGSEENIHNVGSLSLDNLLDMNLMSIEEFDKEFGISLEQPTILTTFHPETVDVSLNEEYVKELSKALDQLSSSFQVVITLPNADTNNSVIRSELTTLSQSNSKIHCFENLGVLGYFSCMKHADLLLGNTSSGIIEAASFGNYVINLGNRQKGRAQSENTIDVDCKSDAIVAAVNAIPETSYSGENIYSHGNATDRIMEVLSQYNATIKK